MAVQVVFRNDGKIDGAGGGCLLGVVHHASFHFSESKLELDEVRVDDELDNAKVNVPGVEGEFTVAGVKQHPRHP